ncbi:VOC family protein [Saccharopolyspora sp. NPDC000359]|uniref:VOC family protein n=1 Tax=Saccharopolyspora sp. NPDC000359 TaxID=3154251 RepID=UPI003327A4F3
MTNVEPRLDHLVYGVPDLLAGVRAVADLLGVDPVPGGRHPDNGTQNYLVGLGGRAYLEVIGPDPTATRPPTAFGLATLTVPRLVTWAVRTPDLDQAVSDARGAGHDPGEPRPMSRRTPDGQLLEWRLAKREPSPRDGLVPFLIDWGSAPHPADSGLPQVRLLALRAEHPDPESVRADLRAVGVHLELTRADAPTLRAEIEGPGGRVELR